MMSKQSGGTRYKDWEMKDITTKPKGLRRSRMLKVKSTSSFDEEDLGMGTAAEGEATQRGDNHSSVTQLKRLSTIHHVSVLNVECVPLQMLIGKGSSRSHINYPRLNFCWFVSKGHQITQIWYFL